MRMEPLEVKHLEDVIKSHENQIRRVLFAKAINSLWHLGSEKRVWVCWIFHFKKIQLSCQNTLMQHLHIPTHEAEHITRYHRSTRNMYLLHNIFAGSWPVLKPDRFRRHGRLAARAMGTLCGFGGIAGWLPDA